MLVARRWILDAGFITDPDHTDDTDNIAVQPTCGALGGEDPQCLEIVNRRDPIGDDESRATSP
jgi:hypothetical protein